MGVREEAFAIIDDDSNLPDGLTTPEEVKEKLKRIIRDVLRDENSSGGEED